MPDLPLLYRQLDSPLNPERLNSATGNPFLQLIESSAPLPKFESSRSQSPENEAKAARLLESRAASQQLDGLLDQMFQLIKNDVEPFISDKNTKVSLRSYEALTKNLVKSLKR